MNLFDFLLTAALAFGLCFLVDKGFTKAFRSAPQHKSGRSVRQSKHLGGAGIALLVLAVLGLFAADSWLLWAASGILAAVGVAFIGYYMTFGIYYDDESFLLCVLGKKRTVYRFCQICSQQLYVSGGKAVIELYMEDGRTFHLQPTMTGIYPFLETAFSGWCSQKDLKKEDCPHYDPDNTCYFPALED